MYIAFDIGNVLCSINFDNFYKKLVKFKVCDSIQEAKDSLATCEKSNFLGIKKITDFFKDSIYVQKSELLDFWNQTVVPNKKMIKFIKEIKSKGFNVAILSNIGPEHAEYLKIVAPEIFNGTDLHLSYEVGSFKPQKLYYQSFLMEHPCYKNCIYLDDREENIKMGNDMGLYSELFNLEQLINDNKLNKKIKKIREKLYLM